ncbi:MAG: hypothetical protein OXF09_08870 [Hyphomicrobiales bacterium]|nr:hypothetical protein [Hyphomicrobiales bacterium]
MPEVDSELGLDDSTPLKEEDVNEEGEVDSFDEIKQKILEPYARWIGEQDRITQFSIIFVAFPFLLGFLHHSAVLFADYFWETSWNSFWGFLLSLWLLWGVSENS